MKRVVDRKKYDERQRLSDKSTYGLSHTQIRDRETERQKTETERQKNDRQKLGQAENQAAKEKESEER